MQLAVYMCAFLKYPLGPKVALDCKHNFILSMAIFFFIRGHGHDGHNKI